MYVISLAISVVLLINSICDCDIRQALTAAGILMYCLCVYSCIVLVGSVYEFDHIDQLYGDLYNTQNTKYTNCRLL